MTNEDIHAFRLLPAAPAVPAQASTRRLWPWLLAGLAVLLLLAAVALGAGLLSLLDTEPWQGQLLVNNEPWPTSSWLSNSIGAAVAFGLALLLVAVVVPLLLLVAVVTAASVALALALALGAGLLALATVATVGLAPLWLFGLLLWLALRPRRRSIAA